MMRPGNIRRWLAVGGAAVVGLTTVTATGISAAPAASAASSKAPIVVGGVYQAADYPGMGDGFDARITQFNKAGGIDGRQVQFLGVTDDGGDPSTDQALIQKLVQSDHVTAVAPLVTEAFTDEGATFLQQQKTPYIGWGISPSWCDPGRPYAFSIDGCIVATGKDISTATAGGLAKISSKKPSEVRVAIVNQDNAGSEPAVVSEGRQFKQGGYDVVFDKGIIPLSGVTNYAPYVEQILASKPDVVFLSLAFAPSIALSAALTAGGYTGIEYSPTDYAEGILESLPSVKAAIQDQYVYSEMPTAEDDSPAVKQIHDAMTAIGKGSEPISLGVTLGYYDADLFVQMLQNTAKKGEPLTSAGIAEAANSGFTYQETTKGGACSEHFPGAETTGVVGDSLLQVKGDQYVLKVPYTCYKNVTFTG